jgi:hypothetical protein
MTIKNFLFGLLCLIAIGSSLVSCKKEATPTPAIIVHQFIPQVSDPYSGAVPVGAKNYMFLKTQIAANNSYNFYQVYINRATTLPYGSDGNIYYNPVLKHDSVVFGVNVYSNSAVLRTNANASVVANGYVLMSSSVDGGAANKTYDIVVVPDQVKL